MKKVLFFICLLALVTSCSNQDDSNTNINNLVLKDGYESPLDDEKTAFVENYIEHSDDRDYITPEDIRKICSKQDAYVGGQYFEYDNMILKVTYRFSHDYNYNPPKVTKRVTGIYIVEPGDIDCEGLPGVYPAIYY